MPAKAAADPVLFDIQLVRSEMYRLCARLADASGISAGELMALLNEVSVEAYEAGIDRIFAEAELMDRDNVADSFDTTWLSLLAVKLNNYRPKKRGRK